MPRPSSKSKKKISDAENENAAVSGKVSSAPVSLAVELEQMTRKMNMISLEKEKAELLLKEREIQLQQQSVEELRLNSLLEAKELEQKKLEEKVRNLQKIKEFQPTIDLAVAAVSKDPKKKDPNHIKRPMTPFMLWSKEQRDEVKKDHPEASFAEMSKLLGDKWKTVSKLEKKPYDERYQVEKEVYLKLVDKEKRETEAMKIYEEEHNKKIAVDLLAQYLQFKNEKTDDGKKKKKEKDPQKPKKPTSAFFVFSNEQRPALLAAKMKVTEIGKKLGEEWKTLDEKSREPYEKIAAAEKARYAKELEEYKLRKASELEAAEENSKEQALIRKAQGMQLLKQREQIDQVKKNLKEEKSKKKKEKAEEVDPNKPKRPPTSYILFVVENRKLIQQQKPGASFSEVTATLAVRWQELADDEKQKWVERAALARETYKTAMEQYNEELARTAAHQQVVIS